MARKNGWMTSRYYCGMGCAYCTWYATIVLCIIMYLDALVLASLSDRPLWPRAIRRVSVIESPRVQYTYIRLSLQYSTCTAPQSVQRNLFPMWCVLRMGWLFFSLQSLPLYRTAEWQKGTLFVLSMQQQQSTFWVTLNVSTSVLLR